MTDIATEKNDNVYRGGIFLLLLSFFLFCAPLIFSIRKESLQGLFVVNYGIVVVYFTLLLATGRLRRGRDGLKLVFILLNLCLISCYSLNREMTVFDESTDWLSIVLILSCLNHLLFAYYHHLPRWVRNLSLFISGVSLFLFTYLSIYLLPTFPIGIIGLIAVGLSIHVFIPAFLVYFTMKQLVRIGESDRKAWRYVVSGFGSVIVLVIIYTLTWSSTLEKINEANRMKSIKGSAGMPAWISVAQKIPNNLLAERILKTEIIYSIPEPDFSEGFWRLPVRRWNDESVLHDPLVVIAAMVAGRPNLRFDDKIKILESVYDARHQSEERLWTGRNLLTDQVDTQVDLWPQFSLSYTELMITVTNKKAFEEWRNNTEEAIYTFDLSEGAVVSSLSLWVNGKEEKGILTSKQKADSAYKEIVGVQRRDPSVVHWREGNRVSVRVFPVIAGESRMFKVGITSPLNRVNGKMEYRSISFKGPDFKNAKENITINSQTKSNDLVVPTAFEKNSGLVRSNRAYQPEWSMSLNDQPISNEVFSFDGVSYRVRPYAVLRDPIKIESVYLDINSSWTSTDIDKVWKLVKGKSIYVYDGILLPVNENNFKQVFARLQLNRFSIFPFNSIKDPASSIVITKNEGFSPNLSDLKDSDFLRDLKSATSNPANTYCVFSLNRDLSPYLKTLKEFRVFRYETGTVDLLEELIKKQEFAKSLETPNQVVMENCGLVINSEPVSFSSTAPDHLMRLFSYNHIMQQQGRNMFTDAAINDELVKLAQRANIVTPVSSLIVLETQQDYDRFNISNSETSLKNAAAKGTGAAPEPHEWALILLGALIIARLKFPLLFQKQRA